MKSTSTGSWFRVLALATGFVHGFWSFNVYLFLITPEPLPAVLFSTQPNLQTTTNHSSLSAAFDLWCRPSHNKQSSNVNPQPQASWFVYFIETESNYIPRPLNFNHDGLTLTWMRNITYLRFAVSFSEIWAAPLPPLHLPYCAHRIQPEKNWISLCILHYIYLPLLYCIFYI